MSVALEHVVIDARAEPPQGLDRLLGALRRNASLSAPCTDVSGRLSRSRWGQIRDRVRRLRRAHPVGRSGGGAPGPPSREVRRSSWSALVRRPGELVVLEEVAVDVGRSAADRARAALLLLDRRSFSSVRLPELSRCRDVRRAPVRRSRRRQRADGRACPARQRGVKRERPGALGDGVDRRCPGPVADRRDGRRPVEAGDLVERQCSKRIAGRSDAPAPVERHTS